MAEADMDAIRHALRLAQERGYVGVEVGVGSLTFKADFDPRLKRKRSTAMAAALEQQREGPESVPVRAPLVGYFRAEGSALTAGTKVEQGQVVAMISALGLANDVSAPVSGEVTEVLVEDGQSVEFGQSLALIRVS